MPRITPASVQGWLVLLAGAAAVVVGLATLNPAILGAGGGLLMWTAAATTKGGG